MPISAYVFVECIQGKALDVNSRLRKVQGVRESHVVTGPIDVIAFVEAGDINQLGKFIVDNIQSVGGVLRTSTNIVAD
jgi:DNA-binding Lrp family transcriptional regulator